MKHLAKTFGQASVFHPLNVLVLLVLLTATAARAELGDFPTGPRNILMEPVTQEQLEQALKERDQTVDAIPQFRAEEDFAGDQIAKAQAVPTEIAELARALRYDPDLIYQYVHDQIEFEPLFGIKKGALGALIDKSGNAFDQSALMVELLRASGYIASYVYGEIGLSYKQIANWIGAGTGESVFIGSVHVINVGGIPITVGKVDETGTIGAAVTHVWVKVKIDGTDYVFDPSLKKHNFKNLLDIASPTKYKKDEFLTAALEGATQKADYVQNINQSNIRSSLTTYANRLIRLIRNHPLVASFGLEDVIGGKTIIADSRTLRQALLPHQHSVTEEWPEDIPERYQTRLQIQHQGINVTYSSADIYGKRLTIRYNASNQPELRLEGNLVGTGNAVDPGTTHSASLSVTHPYVSLSANRNADQDIEATPNYTYLITNGWGKMGKGMVEKHRRLLSEYRQAGQAADSEAVLGENLMLIASHWLAQASKATELNDGLSSFSTSSLTLVHSLVGITGQKTGPYVDLPLQVSSVISLLGVSKSSDSNDALFFSTSGIKSALEHSVIEQTQPVKAVSTVQLLDFANSQSNKIYEVSKAKNNFETIRPLLTGYSKEKLDFFKSEYIDKDFRILLPENGSLDQEEGDSWQGYGVLIISADEENVIHQIGGGLKGGFSRWPISPASYRPIPVSIPRLNTFSNVNKGLTSFDPIDLVTGDFLYDNDDLIVGSSALPVGLGLQRHYSSASRLANGTLGYGWNHNFEITAKQDSNAYQGLGEDSPIDAAAAIVAVYVSLDIMQGEKTKEKLMILTLIQKWMTDQLTDNTVVVSTPGDTQQFIKLPDGSYNPAPGRLSKLTKKSDGSYSLKSKQGVVMDFATDGKLKTRQDANGNTLTLSYNGDGQVASASNNFNRTLTFNYQDKKLSEVLDGTGRKVQYSYDAEGNLASFTNADNQITRYVYDLVGRMTQVFTPQYPEAPVVTNVYDSRDKVTQQTNGDNHIYNYYFAGHRSEEVDPLDHSKIWYYNERGENVQAIDELNRKTRSSYDGQQRLKLLGFPGGNVLQNSYDQYHRVIKTTHHHPDPDSKEKLIQTYTYENTFHKLKTSTDALGRVTDFHYDAQGNLIKIEQPAVAGIRPTLLYSYNINGQRSSETDAEGRITRYSYDTSGDLISIARDPDNLNLVTTLTYDAVGNLETQTDPNKNTTRFTYDPERRKIEAKAPEPFNTVTQYHYDKDGLLIDQQNETGDPDQPWQTTQFVYNRNDKVIRETDPENHITEFVYDGKNRLITTIDAENRLTDTKYDAAGQVIEVIKLLKEVPTTVAKYTYTENGQQQTVTDGNGNTTDYTYDGFDRRITTTYPDKSEEMLAYDAVGNVIKRRTRAEEWFKYDYDPLDRLSTKTRPDTSVVQHSYDLSSVKTNVSEDGQDWIYQYDTAGRLKKTINPAQKTVQYGYDNNGNRIQLTYPDGYQVDYVYDQLNRLDSIKQGENNTLAKYSYDVLSRRKTLTYGNGTQTDYSYELDNDVAQIEATLTGQSIQHTYQYNATSQLKQRSSNGDTLWLPNSQISSIGPFTVTNRLPGVKAPTFYESNNLNQYDVVGEIAYQYDGNGNLTSDGINSYGYDPENRLISATRPNYNTSYQYDPMGRRVEKTVDGATTEYLYDGVEILLEYNQEGAIQSRFVYGAGIDQPILMAKADKRYYYHTDYQGSVIALSDGTTGAVVEQYGYGPYGESNGDSSVGNPYRYTGRRLDEETGLYYYRARYYDPELGRFLQTDPIGYGDGLNLYAYVGNDPVNYVDPSGLAGRSSNRFSLNPVVSRVPSRGAGTSPIRLSGDASPSSSTPSTSPSSMPLQVATGKPGFDVLGFKIKEATESEEQTAVRTTRGGDKAVRIRRPDGSVIDISPDRVKEFVPNTHPKAPSGALDRIKFENAIPGSKGFKRLPTQNELDILKNAK